MRFIFPMAAVCSVYLCVTSLAWGLVGFSAPREFSLTGTHRSLYCSSSDGVFRVIWSEGWPNPDWIDSARLVATPMPLTIHSFIIVEETEERLTLSPDGNTLATITYRGLRSNLLYCTFFPLLIPFAWLLARRRNRPRENLCPPCGYDLRASTIRCPECGAPFLNIDAETSFLSP